MLLRFQKAAVRGNYETGNQAFFNAFEIFDHRRDKSLNADQKKNLTELKEAQAEWRRRHPKRRAIPKSVTMRDRAPCSNESHLMCQLGSFVRHQDHREIGPARHIEFVANDVAVFAGCLRHAGFERAEITCLHVNFSQWNAV